MTESEGFMQLVLYEKSTWVEGYMALPQRKYGIQMANVVPMAQLSPLWKQLPVRKLTRIIPVEFLQ